MYKISTEDEEREGAATTPRKWHKRAPQRKVGT